MTKRQNRFQQPDAGAYAPGDVLDPRSLGMRSRFEYLGSSYRIFATLIIGPQERWRVHYAEDAAGLRRWLSVRDTELVWWWSGVLSDFVVDEPTVVVDGVTYRQIDHDTTTYRAEGDIGHEETGSIDYIHYRDEVGGRYVAYYRFSGEGWGTGKGERMGSGHLRILPDATG